MVFDSLQSGHYEVYGVLATGGTPRRLTSLSANDGVAAYSVDGKHIYFGSRRDGERWIWRMRPDGSEPLRITKGGGHAPALPRGREISPLPQVRAKGRGRVACFGGGRRRGRATPGGTHAFSIWHFRFKDKARRKVRDVEAKPSVGRLAASPDGRTLLWGQVDTAGSEPMTIDP